MEEKARKERERKVSSFESIQTWYHYLGYPASVHATNEVQPVEVSERKKK